jgi:hypothetical protein
MPTTIATEPVFQALLQNLALIGDEERRQAIQTYIETARTPLERALFDLMSQLVSAVEAQVGERYRIQLTYQPGGLALDVEAKAAAAGEEPAWSASEGDVEKITIRIPAELKDLAQQAASRAGTSANTWFVKALARAVRNVDVQTAPPPSSWREERRHGGRGSRLSGWVGGDED